MFLWGQGYLSDRVSRVCLTIIVLRSAYMQSISQEYYEYRKWSFILSLACLFGMLSPLYQNPEDRLHNKVQTANSWPIICLLPNHDVRLCAYLIQRISTFSLIKIVPSCSENL